MRCLECHQLQGALSQRQRLRALEHAASRRGGESSICHTDVQGRSGAVHCGVRLHEGVAALRDFFEVDAKHIVLATLGALARENKIGTDVVKRAIQELGINPDKANPAVS